MRIILGFLSCLMVLTMAVGCSGRGEADSQGAAQVSYEEAKQLIDDGKVQVVDVRTAEEYAEGHIPDAVNIPLQDIESRLDELDASQAYLLVCRSGSRSAQAQSLLEQQGYTLTYNMLGGMTEWPYATEKP